jgi:hypothetical protein
MTAMLRGAALPLLVLGTLSLGTGGCATSGLVNAWRDPMGPKAPLENVLVIAVKKDEGARRLMEDAFVSALVKQGVRATPSYRLFATAVPDTQQVLEAVARDGYDGVIVSSRLPTDTVETPVPGYTTIEPRTRYNSWRMSYQTRYVEVDHPGYVAVDRIVRHRVEVWAVKDGGGLLWTAEGQSIDPTSNADVNKEITRAVIPELVKSGILAKRSRS